MTSKRAAPLSEEEPEMDESPGLFDARMQPLVKLYRIGRYCTVIKGTQADRT